MREASAQRIPAAPPSGGHTRRARAVARAICARLQAAGHIAYLAGGCVRDRLLGRTPHDFDVATSARPEQVQALFRRTVAVGARFGVVVVLSRAGPIEVATFRSDDAYVDGRRPSTVRFVGPEEDALRRDFTINALFEDPLSGEVLDFVGGRADLAARTIRAIGDPAARMREDHLRLVRAVRLAAELGFTIEPATLAAVRAHAELVRQVAPERLLPELTRLIVAPGRVAGLQLMKQTGLLRVLLPEVDALAGVEQPPEYHPEGDCWNHQLLVMQHLPEEPPAELAWAALLHDIGKPPTFRRAERIRFDGHAALGAAMAEQVLARLRAPGKLRAVVAELVREHLRFMEVRNMRASTLKRFLRRPTAELHLELHRADCLASHGKLDNYWFCRERLRAYRAEGEAQALRPPRLLTGHDLIRAGYRPGPAFAQMLRAVEDAQLEGEVQSPEQALALVRARFGPPPAGPAQLPAGDCAPHR
ncbi:MAG: HDIG domain-containing protein [Planctomycetota bacterium]|nr:MAG: HDIG domain-containing protein [Planctomycetota bacterium]